MTPHGILWEGPSPVDGMPLVAISVWPQSGKVNPKTGKMAQVYILRGDVSPTDAVASGADVSNCGPCPLRSPQGQAGRACYVNLGQGPTMVWNAYRAGKYRFLAGGAALWSGRGVRWGAYGDPAMLPEWLVAPISHAAEYWVGYTHQWRQPWAQWGRRYWMASVETPEQESRARGEGWGTFRAGRRDGSDLGSAELCMNERDGTTCADCRMCNGSKISIFIPAHGWGAKNIPAEKLVRRKREQI